jgi:hypothetical protein
MCFKGPFYDFQGSARTFLSPYELLSNSWPCSPRLGHATRCSSVISSAGFIIDDVAVRPTQATSADAPVQRAPARSQHTQQEAPSLAAALDTLYGSSSVLPFVPAHCRLRRAAAQERGRKRTRGAPRRRRKTRRERTSHSGDDLGAAGPLFPAQESGCRHFPKDALSQSNFVEAPHLGLSHCSMRHRCTRSCAQARCRR